MDINNDSNRSGLCKFNGVRLQVQNNLGDPFLIMVYHGDVPFRKIIFTLKSDELRVQVNIFGICLILRNSDYASNAFSDVKCL